MGLGLIYVYIIHMYCTDGETVICLPFPYHIRVIINPLYFIGFFLKLTPCYAAPYILPSVLLCCCFYYLELLCQITALRQKLKKTILLKV